MEAEVGKFIPCLILNCLQHTDAHFYFKDELSKLNESDLFESISDCVIHFYIAFDAEYKEIIENVFVDPQFMKSKSRFLTKIGSRCLKMCEEPTFFNFLLMCGFVGRVASFCYMNGKCYRVAENACKCAVASFKRKFLGLFNREGGLNGLWTYSHGLNECVLNLQDQFEDLKDILSPDQESKQLVLSLLENCKDVDSTQYFLTEFERKLLYKVTKKRLRKQKPNLDLLIRRIPKRYFQIQNSDSQKVMCNIFESCLVNIESNLRVEYSQLGDNTLISPYSISCRNESCLSPIDYSMKRYPESSNCCITEKLSEPLNNCEVEKRSKLPNNFIIRDKSESSNYCLIEKRAEPSHYSVIEKQPEPTNCCVIEDEIEPLDCRITNNDHQLTYKETIPKESLSLVYYKPSRGELQSANYETSSKQPECTTETPRLLKRSYSGRSMDLELSKEAEQIRSSDYLEIGISPKKYAATVSKRPKILNSPQSKLSLETGFSLSPKQYLPQSNDSRQNVLHLPCRFLMFEDESSNAKKGSFDMEAEFAKKCSSKFPISSDKDYSIQNYPSTSSSKGNYLPLKPQKEKIPPLASTDSLYKTPTKTPILSQLQCLTESHQSNPSLNSCSAVTSANYNSDHNKRFCGTSKCSSSNESSSTSSIQPSSEGYFTSESDISEVNGNEEFQLSPLHFPEMNCSDSSPSESEYYYSDWKGDTSLKSLISHKCFHCGTKCFNYIMYVFQEFTSHFLD